MQNADTPLGWLTMLPFNSEIFEEWQADYEAFNYHFRQFCFQQFRVFDVSADFVPNVTRQIHAQWVADCEHWLKVETDPTTTKLSYLKRAALLLHSLTSEQFIGNLFPHEYDEEPIRNFQAPQELYEIAKRDFLDAREAVLALDFVLIIIDYFERYRIDRSDDYKLRLTRDMRHDLLSYLLSGSVDKKALYLILKALHLRPTAGGAAN